MATIKETQLFTAWEGPPNNDSGCYHVYAITYFEDVPTIPHNSYLCSLVISENNKPLSTSYDYMKNLESNGGQPSPFMNHLCPKCKEILKERFPDK